MSNIETKIEEYKRNMEQSRLEYEKLFPYEEQLKSKLSRQFELNSLLDLNKKNGEVIVDEDTFPEKKEVTNEFENDEEEMVV